MEALTDNFFKSKLSEDKLSAKQDKYCRPQNCENPRKRTVNPEIWSQLKPGTRSRDIKCQKVQGLLVSPFVPQLQLTDKLLAKENSKKGKTGQGRYDCYGK